jgi:hypothetical protein
MAEFAVLGYIITSFGRLVGPRLGKPANEQVRNLLQSAGILVDTTVRELKGTEGINSPEL